MYTSPQMIIHRKQSVLIYFFIAIKISPQYEMIWKAEPCSVVSIQNQLTLCIGTVIIQQIPVPRKLKLLFDDCAAHALSNCEYFVIIMNFLFKLFEILAWIIRSGGFYEKHFLNKKTKNSKIKKL